MANQSFNIKVNVGDGGDIEKIKRALAGLGASVTATRRNTAGANKDSVDFFDTQKKGIIGTANSTKSFSKLAETIGGRSSGLVSAYAELAANAFALTAAFNLLRGAAQVEQIFKGLEASGARTGQALTVTATKMREVSGAAIDMEQALRSTSQITAAGFGSETVLRLTQAAKDASFALGRNMTDSLDRLSRGVVKLEPELLDELGIMTKLTESNTNYARQLGKTETQLTGFEKRQGFLNAVLEEAELKFGGLSASAGNTTAYDKLAASLSDLSKTVLNVANVALKPLAGLLSSSPVLVLGAAIGLFGASIASKLLPALASSASSAKLAADAAKQHAADLRAETIAAYDTAKANANLAQARKRAETNLGPNGGPARYRDARATINSGNATEKDFKTAENSLRASIRANEQLTANNPKFAEGTADGIAKKAYIELLKQELVLVGQLRTINTQTNTLNAEGVYAVRQAKLAYLAASKEAAAYEGRAAAIGAASQLSLGASIRENIKATKNYAQSLVLTQIAQKEALAQNGPGPGITDKIKGGFGDLRTSIGQTWALLATPDLSGMNKAKVAAFGLGTAVRAAGSAFLAAIPVIGQIVFALSIAKMLMEELKSETTKKLEKAFAEFEETVKSTDAAITSYNRALNSTANLGLRAQQAILIQSNAISTLVDSYQELALVQEQVGNKSKSSGNKVAGYFSTFDNTAYASYLLNVKQGSQVLKAFEKSLPSSFGMPGGVTNDPVLSGAIVTLDRLKTLAPEATEKAMRFAGGWKAFTNLPLEAQLGTVAKIADTVNNEYKDAAQRVTSLGEAFKGLNQSISDFALGQQQTTPFDQVVKGFQSVNNELRSFASASANVGGGGTSNLFKGLLSEVGSGVEAFLSTPTKQKLDEFKAINEEVQQIEKNKSLGLDYDQKELDNLKRRRNTQSAVLNDVGRELKVMQQRFEVAQQMNRVLKSEQAVLQANLSANQANYAATASGVKARLEGENKVKQLQISQLEVQKGLIKSYITQNLIQVEGLKAEIEKIKLSYDFNKSIDEGNVLLELRNARQREDAAAKQLEDKGYSANAVLSGNLSYYEKARMALAGEDGLSEAYLKARTEAEKLKKINDGYVGVDKAQQAIKGYEASVSSLINQISALAISESTVGQIAAESAAKRAEIINQQANQLGEQKKTLENIRTLEIASSRLAQGRATTIADELEDITRIAAVSKAQLDNERQNNIRTLEAEIGKAKADAAKANDSASKTANADRLALLQEQLRIEEQGYQVNILNIDAQTRNNILQKVAFDTQSVGLEMQKDALSYLQKQLDIRKELVDATREQGILASEVNRRQFGLKQTDASKASDEIKAAKAAYDYAVESANVRKNIITLEYALLDAQRQTSLNNLETQKAGLIAAGEQNSDMVRQLDATITTLRDAGASIADAQRDASRLVDTSVENARLNYRKAALPEGTRTSLSQQLKSRAEQRALQLEANSGRGDRKIPESEITPVVAPLVRSNTLVVTALNSVATQAEALNRTLIAQIADKQTGLENATNSTLSRINGYETRRLTPSFPGTSRTPITEKFGAPRGSKGTHNGTDFGTGMGTNIGAPAAGVLKYGSSKDGGLEAYIQHAGNIRTGFAHLSKIIAPEGTVLKQGEVFAKSGNSGENTTGAHLHYTVTVNGEKVDPMKPIRVPVVTVIEPKTLEKTGQETAQVISNTLKSNLPDLIQAWVDQIPIVVPGNKSALGAANDNKTQVTRMPASIPALDNFNLIMDQPNSILEAFQGMADKLGPQGTLIPAIITGISSVGKSYTDLLDTFAGSKTNIADLIAGGMPEGQAKAADFADKVQAVASIATAALFTISSVLKAGTDAKIANIDKEIAAEQRRDGKSAESVAKIAAMEKRKDAINRKAFNVNKKIMMAQAIISTAAGVAGALAAPFGLGIPLAIAVGAMGAAQLAIIAGTSYQSTATGAKPVSAPSVLKIGKIGDTVDLAKQNNNVGGELGYLRGSQGYGNNSSNYRTIGSAYGGDMPRGYGSASYVVGEKGPETITPTMPMTVRPMDSSSNVIPMNPTINIHAIDARGVEEVLRDQKGNLISMLREAANSNGVPFMENVNVDVLSRPNRTAGTKL